MALNLKYVSLKRGGEKKTQMRQLMKGAKRKRGNWVNLSAVIEVIMSITSREILSL